MAKIDELRWELILDDKNFDARIKKDAESAKKLNLTLSQYLTAKKKELAYVNELDRVYKRNQKTISDTNVLYTRQSRLLRQLSTMAGAYFSVYGIRRFLSSMIEITGQFEVQKMALRTILQDVEAADQIFQDLYKFSSDSTYRFSELAKYSKQLAAFNISKDSLLETTKMLGDVASGVGVSMDRLILAYGHVKSSGFLRGIQLRSFSQNGVPVLDELAKMLTDIEGRAVSLGEVFDKMTKREISFDMVEEAFRRMTSEGGKFYKMQEVLSKTLAGQINILKGRWENLMYAVGQSQDGLLKGAVGTISSLIADYEKLGQTIKEIIGALVTYKGVLISMELASGSFALANHRVLSSLVRIGRWISGNPYAILAAAITAVAVATYRYVTALTSAEKIQKVVARSEADFTAEIARQSDELDNLYFQLNQAKKGTEEYDAAKKAIQSRYSEYISQLQQEGVAVDNLADIYVNLKQKIEDATRERFLSTATESLEKTLAEEQKKWLDVALDQKILGEDYSFLGVQFWNQLKTKPTATQKNAYRQYLLGLTDLKGLRASAHAMPDAGIEDVISLIMGAGAFSLVDGAADTKTVTENIRKNLEQVMDEYRDGINGVNALFYTGRGTNVGQSTPEEVRDWVKKVNAELNKLDPEIVKKVGLNPKEDEDYYDYLERIGKGFKDINEQKDKALSMDVPKYEGWISAIKQVDSALEGNILSDVRYNKTPWKSSGSDTEDNKRISAIKTEISSILRLKDAYDALARNPLIGEEGAKSVMQSFFPDRKADYEDQINALLEALSGFKDKPGIVEYMESVKDSLGKDVLGSFNKLLSAYEKLKETRDKLEASDTSKEGVDAIFDMKNALSAYVTKVNEIKRAREENIKLIKKAQSGDEAAIKVLKDQVGDMWDYYVEKGDEAFNRLANNEIDSEKAVLYDKLNSIANTYVNSLVKKLPMKNLGRKSLSQINKLLGDLSDVRTNGLGALSHDEKLQETLTKEGLTLDQFIDKYNALLDALQKNVEEEKVKKLITDTKALLGVFGDVVDVVQDFGDKIDNKALKNLGQVLGLGKEIADVFLSNENIMRDLFSTKNIEQAADAIGDVAEDVANVADDMTSVADSTESVAKEAGNIASSADWITMIIKLVLIAVKSVANQLGDYYSELNRIEKTIRDILADVEKERIEKMLSSDGIFGNNPMGIIRNAVELIADAKNARGALEDARREFLKTAFLETADTFAIDSTRKLRKIEKAIAEFNNMEMPSLEDTQIKVGDQISNVETLEEIAKRLNMEVYDDIGNINYKLLERINELYGEYNEGLEKWLEEAKKYANEYESAMASVTDTMKSLFGEIASSASDAIVDRWIAAGDAALDYADILDGVAKSYAKMLVQSAIMDNVFGDQQHINELVSRFMGGDTEGVMDAIANDMEKIAELQPVYEEIMKIFDPYFKGGETDNTLANGIKGITEDTAGLLASYINAIRADVSSIRMLAESGWGDIRLISGFASVLPTLGDYLAQVAATNYDIAQSNRQILTEIQGVITSTSGRRAIAVDMQ